MWQYVYSNGVELQFSGSFVKINLQRKYIKSIGLSVTFKNSLEVVRTEIVIYYLAIRAFGKYKFDICFHGTYSRVTLYMID